MLFQNHIFIIIPKELIELKENWCNELPGIENINVVPTNHRYCCHENKMINGKINVDQNYYVKSQLIKISFSVNFNFSY